MKNSSWNRKSCFTSWLQHYLCKRAISRLLLETHSIHFSPVLYCKSIAVQIKWLFLYECNTELKWVRSMLPSYRNCSTYLHWKSVNWFLHDGNILKWVSGEEKEMIFVRGMNFWVVNSFSHPRWKSNHIKFTACK